MHNEIIRVLVMGALAFIVAISWTPILTNFLYRYKLGKRIRNAGNTPIFSSLHAKKSGTPTMGGILIWLTAIILAFVTYFLAKIWPQQFAFFNFLSRSETWLPFGILVSSALVGLLDDYLDVRGIGVFGGGGLKIKHRLIIYTLIAIIGSLWFYFKLGRSNFFIPFIGNIDLGWIYIFVFIFIIVVTAFSVNETDGLDGLAGGSLLYSYTAYAVIAILLGMNNLAVFCAVIVGGLLAFLWFNIPPARFYMGDTGAMSLGITLGLIAMLTNTAVFLLIIGFVFVIESLSVIIQLTSKKFRHKKVFQSAPIHHHLEAIGWPESKIVMRFWVISSVTAVIGVVAYLLTKY